MAKHSTSLTLHWDGDDRELNVNHRIDALSLAKTVSGIQEVICLLAMELENREPADRGHLPNDYYRRFALTFEAAERGSYVLVGQVGSNEDLLRKGMVPEVLARFSRVLGEIADDAKFVGDEVKRNLGIHNPGIRKRVTRQLENIIPGAGSNRRLAINTGGSREIFLCEKSRTRLKKLIARSDDFSPEPVRSVVTGQLLEMNFAEKTFLLFYPPTQKALTCHYDDIYESTLLENPRNWIQVNGVIINDAGGSLERIVNVNEVYDLDLSEIAVSRVRLDKNCELVLNQPLVLLPCLAKDGQQLLEAVDTASGIDAFGVTREELIEAIDEDIRVIWSNYAHPTLPLDEDAENIGRWWQTRAVPGDGGRS